MGQAIHEAYQRVGFETASREELLLLMYANILRCLRRSRKARLKNETTRAQIDILTAQAGVVELRKTVNMAVAPELGDALRKLYVYVIELLGRALINNDLVALDAAVNVISDLEQTWRQALKEAA